MVSFWLRGVFRGFYGHRVLEVRSSGFRGSVL